MKALEWITLLLIIIGGLNWGLIGLFEFNLVNTIFGFSWLVERIIYILVGLAAIYQLLPLMRMMSSPQTSMR